MITIVSHDAGGAEILSEWIKNKKIECNYCLQGPAIKIFKNKISKINLSNYKDVIKKSELVITGSSWPSRFEITAIKDAIKNQVKVVTFLDHWIHYQLRFLFNGKLILPNEIWVGDKVALKIAKKEMPKVLIKLKKNMYLANKIKRIKKFQKKIKEENLLYLCSPVIKNKYYKNNKHLFKYNEKKLLEYFIKNVNFLNVKYKKIIIRLHPSEKIEKYYWLKKDINRKKIKFSKNNKLEKDIASSKVVLGFNSNAMVISVLSGKKVYNVSPAGKNGNILPFKKILNFKNIIKKNVKKN